MQPTTPFFGVRLTISFIFYSILKYYGVKEIVVTEIVRITLILVEFEVRSRNEVVVSGMKETNTLPVVVALLIALEIC